MRSGALSALRSPTRPPVWPRLVPLSDDVEPSLADLAERSLRDSSRPCPPSLPDPDVALDYERALHGWMHQLSVGLVDRNLVCVVEALAQLVNRSYQLAVESGVDLDAVGRSLEGIDERTIEQLLAPAPIDNHVCSTCEAEWTGRERRCPACGQSDEEADRVG